MTLCREERNPSGQGRMSQRTWWAGLTGAEEVTASLASAQLKEEFIRMRENATGCLGVMSGEVLAAC